MSEKDDKTLSLAERIRQKQAVQAQNTPEDGAKDTTSGTLQAAFAGAQAQDAPKAPDIEKVMRQRAEEKAARLSERIQAKRAAAIQETKAEEEDPLAEDEAAALQATVDALRERHTALIAKVTLTDIVAEVESLGHAIEDMPDSIAQIRNRGYQYHSYLEGKTTVLAEKWDEVNDKIDTWLENEANDLEDELAAAEDYVEQMSGGLTRKHEAIANRLASLLDTLEAKVAASEARVEAIYQEVEREAMKTRQLLVTLTRYLDWMEEASFELEGNEGIYMIAEAEWRDDGDKPDGFLYLTNQRLVFEQNEKVGKRLGMFGGKKVREVLWEVPLDTLEQSTAENKGMLGGIDLVHLTFGSGARYAEITIEVKGGVAAQQWATQIKRAAKGHIAQDSTIEPDPALIERLRDAPTDCPTCGATFPTIDVGDTDVHCAYCGTVVRI